MTGVYGDAYDPLDGVAVIAVSGRFPGADDVEQFWENLVAGRETISHFSEEELEPASAAEAALRREDGYVRARGILSDVAGFDAELFRMSPREAEVTDPQHRIFLETAWEALERAGYDPQRYDGAIGVYAGMTNNTYFLENLLPRPDVLATAGELPMLGNEKDYLATRVSYKLDLRGPSVNVVTACSSSLVAVCHAVQSLVMHQCDIALAGGVSVRVPQRRGYLHQEGFITSPDGHCRAFDEQAAGTVFSNGVGIVVLKRLDEALEDGDQIYAVVKGAAVNNDGSARVSFTAPSVAGQAEAIATAQALAGIDPDTISFVEAHGTGTALGDPVEVAALTQAFRIGTDRSGYCALGSVKTNIGHLDAAAGVTGLIKTALALHHEALPPTLHFTAPNPKLELDQSPFYVNAELAPWPRHDAPRRAGVSSLGAGGTNAHVVLEEAPVVPAGAATRPEQVLVLSARTPTALDAVADRLRGRLLADPDLDLADVAYTLQVGRRRFDHRRVVVASSREDAVRSLESDGTHRPVSATDERQEAGVAFLFPGQGAQRVQMGRGLYEREPAFRTCIDECSETLRPHLGSDLRTILYPALSDAHAAAEALTQTAVAQPALFVTSLALASMWREWGIEPEAMIGHSLGEFVAACLAGVFDRDDALALVARRAALMQGLPRGAMLAVRASSDEVEPALADGLAVAAYNAPKLTVVSGPEKAISALALELADRGVAAKQLVTSHAFHSSMMDPAVEAFGADVAAVALRPPAIPFVSSVSGDWITPEQAMDAGYWAAQLREPVRFEEGIGRLLDRSGLVLLEVGPGDTLTGIARQHAAAGGRAPIPSLPRVPGEGSDIEAMLLAVGRLWMAGCEPDWPGVHGGGRRRRVALPTYPFERKRHWVDPVAPASATADAVALAAVQPVPSGSARDELEQSEVTMIDTTGDGQVRPRARVEARLRTLFAELSGMDESELAAEVPFLELGLDSLFLTQATTAVHKTFGVRVAFRELLDEASTLGALATRVSAELPPEPVESATAPAPAVLGGAQVAVPAGLAVGPGDGDQSVVERVVAQQMELMSRQLELLRMAGASVPNGATPVPRDPLPPAPPVGRPAPEEPTRRPAGTAFGPYRPPAKGPTGGMSERQEAAVAALVARYTARTAGSKRFTAENRPHLADPRSVAGFRLLWKEMVYPIVTTGSNGSRLIDVDGNEYVDLTNGFGMIMFGHNPPFLREAIEAQLARGIEIGPQTVLAGEVSRLVCELTGMERVGFCNTGSEAVMAAIRVARTVSGRDRIAMFADAYHGVFDEVLVRPTRIGGRLQSMPVAPGIPESAVENVLVLEYGSDEALALLREHGPELAAVLVEPVQSRRPALQPVEFLREVRALTEQSGSALVFDEVVSGFRSHPGGTQALFGIEADLATYGKVIGGGLPIGLVAGRGMYMDALDGGQWSYGDDSFPEVGVTFFAGTFVRHPLVLAAAKAVLERMRQEGPELQRSLNLRTAALVDRLNAHTQSVGAPLRVTHFSSWFCFEFPPDIPYAGLFYAYMRDRGIHVWEGRAGFLTTAHSDEDIERIVTAFEETVAEMQAADLLPGNGDPPVEGARLGRDPEGRSAWFVPDPARPGKYLQVEEVVAAGD